MWTLTSRLTLLQDRKTWTKNGLGSVDIFCRCRTVSDEVELDHRLEVLGARMTDLRLAGSRERSWLARSAFY